MNKKTIIIIVSVIAALAIAIGGTIALLTSKFKDAPDKDNDSQNAITSSENSKNEDLNSNIDSTSSNNNPSTNNNNDDTSENSTVSVPKANKDMTTFIVDNVSAKQGGKVKVPVYVSSNKGFMGVLGKFKYDTSALKYTGYKKGNLLSDYDFLEQNGEIKFMSIERGDITKDGVAFYLEFDVIATAPTTADVTITIEDNGIANKAEQFVKVDTIDGSVTIK